MASKDINIAIDNDFELSPLTEIENDFAASEPWSGTVSYRHFKEPSARDTNSCLIYKVPYRLREVNEKAYEPNVISIGPYHYGKKHLRVMEDVKRSCFNKITEKTNISRDRFLEAMRNLEERVKKCYEEPCRPYCHDCYEEPCRPHSHDYVEMMVLDGCFIVQLIRKIITVEDLYKLPLGRRIPTDILYDLLLLENQLPFFVLLELDRMIMPNGGGDVDQFARLALSLFKVGLQGSNLWFESEETLSPKNDIKHLLDLVHNSYRPSPQGIKQHNDFKAEAKAKENEKVEVEAEAETKAKVEAKNPNSQRSWKFIRSATELQEAGINFVGEKVQDHNQDQGLLSLFDIAFTEDTRKLRIPTLYVHDNTERFFRNLMAYEQFILSGQPTYVSDYVVFMDNLINTGKDVQLLCNNGIIDNCLGDYEVVAQMFKKLRDFIYLSESDDFYYVEIFGRLDEHCQRKWNKYNAILKRDYFNTPWSLISFLAAVVLLLLTLLQTIFSFLSYFHPQVLSFL